jgi:metal-responsive CopG/Arc/MetJ family transcriptional regulator
MRRTTIYLEPDLELQLKREVRRQKRSMADLIRDAVRRYVTETPGRQPPGAGAFASGKKDTAAKAEEWLTRSGFGGER